MEASKAFISAVFIAATISLPSYAAQCVSIAKINCVERADWGTAGAQGGGSYTATLKQGAFTLHEADQPTTAHFVLNATDFAITRPGQDTYFVGKLAQGQRPMRGMEQAPFPLSTYLLKIAGDGSKTVRYWPGAESSHPVVGLDDRVVYVADTSYFPDAQNNFEPNDKVASRISKWSSDLILLAVREEPAVKFWEIRQNLNAPTNPVRVYYFPVGAIPDCDAEPSQSFVLNGL